ncbi:hypothetical protein OUZ56_032311 [Daphnia magna]|uniref:Uncharacterized protein n=1 Tax=Daphnia magna TaxID=35525 RepID=A0ABQ9ZXT0_9CRUS|nr:hypothetical protein OUZ56_032311 [Daphnia magna]
MSPQCLDQSTFALTVAVNFKSLPAVSNEVVIKIVYGSVFLPRPHDRLLALLIHRCPMDVKEPKPVLKYACLHDGIAPKRNTPDNDWHRLSPRSSASVNHDRVTGLNARDQMTD